MRVADFYCGAGGFSEGFRQAGFDIVFAVDKWEHAVNTFKYNKPTTTVLQEDIIKLSRLEDDEFHSLVPDTEVIIGSPPCIAFSSSNKSGQGDKTLGIELVEAYLRIVARKKYRRNSVLRYWILENVPNIEKYLKSKYTANDLGLPGDFELIIKNESTGIYNAKYFGAPTNRRRFFCGEFPTPKFTHSGDNVLTLGDVLKSLGNPKDNNKKYIKDCCYPLFKMKSESVTDHHYNYFLNKFEWETAKRLKEDRGYMGKMSFPENTNKPSRTVMATMSASSRESMILQADDGKYRLPTVREAATMMSFPIDYRFLGTSKGIKHTLVGNAVPPKISYAIALSIAEKENLNYPENYVPIKHDQNIPFFNLNGSEFPLKVERRRRPYAKFKYHVPYLIIGAYRVELSNYVSDFGKNRFLWTVTIHYSQGKRRARVYSPAIDAADFGREEVRRYNRFIKKTADFLPSTFNQFQEIYCLTSIERGQQKYLGPFELLHTVKEYIDDNIKKDFDDEKIYLKNEQVYLPKTIAIAYFILKELVVLIENK